MMHIKRYSVELSEDVSRDIERKCKQFAEDSDIEYYLRHRNANEKKVRYQIFQGKLAEYVVAHLLHDSFNFPFVEPDIRVYDGADKSWDADLPYGTAYNTFYDIHVKTSVFDDVSWTFQLKNAYENGGTDKEFYSDQPHVYALVVINKSKGSSICATVYFTISSFLKPFLRDPVSNRLKGLKQVIYERDLLPFITEPTTTN